MAEEEHVHVPAGYFPVYPHHDDLPDPDIRTFITNFYRVSDRPGLDELWVSYFSRTATVTMGRTRGTGHEEIRELRKQMWEGIQARRHTVAKAFPARFRETAGTLEEPLEHEVMLFGEVARMLNEGEAKEWVPPVPWAAHMVLRKEKEGERWEWKIGAYRVWLQS